MTKNSTYFGGVLLSLSTMLVNRIESATNIKMLTKQAILHESVYSCAKDGNSFVRRMSSAEIAALNADI